MESRGPLLPDQRGGRGKGRGRLSSWSQALFKAVSLFRHLAEAGDGLAGRHETQVMDYFNGHGLPQFQPISKRHLHALSKEQEAKHRQA